MPRPRLSQTLAEIYGELSQIQPRVGVPEALIKGEDFFNNVE
jgi:hypothetical protein